jgi:hypothetical protein
MCKQRQVYRKQNKRERAEIGGEFQEINGIKKKETGNTKRGNGKTSDTTFRKIKWRRKKITEEERCMKRYI